MKSKSLSHQEVAAFCTQLSLLINAGITPFEAVCLMNDDNENIVYLNEIKNKLSEGVSLSAAISSTGIFPDYMTQMLVLGENTGSLDKILKNLSSFYDKECSIREAMKNAIIYPFMMVFIMLFMIFIILIKILPTINQVYLQLGSTLSGFALTLFHLSKTLQSISIFMYIFFILMLLLIFYVYFSIEKNDFEFDRLPKFDFIKKVLNEISYSRLASCLSLITTSGINLFDGLSYVKNIIHNTDISLKIDNVVLHIQEDGDYIYEALKKEAIFTQIEQRMIQVGYKTGESDLVFEKISAKYEEQVLNRIGRLLNSIEPTLVIIFSLIVGILLISALLPLIGIMSTIG